MNEIWKDIKGYEGIYKINTKGDIKSSPRKGTKGGLLKQFEDKDGYLCVGLNKNDKRKTFKVHRLVAMTFVPNLYDLPEVNHKDEDKTNNCVENLEWCDHEYNSNYGTRGERIAKALSKAVYSIDEYGNVEHFNSINEAQRITGIFVSNIICAITGEYSQSGNRKWYYENSQIANND